MEGHKQMRNGILKLTAMSLLAVVIAAPVLAGDVMANDIKVKTRLDHLSGTPLIIVISTIPSEITQITCDKWVMLGADSWNHQNDFTIPSAGNGVAIAAMNANKFDGYCAKPGSIIGHTDDGDFVGVLDKGDGNWTDSTKLTFKPKPQE
jgi:hypothetical protein